MSERIQQVSLQMSKSVKRQSLNLHKQLFEIFQKNDLCLNFTWQFQTNIILIWNLLDKLSTSWIWSYKFLTLSQNLRTVWKFLDKFSTFFFSCLYHLTYSDHFELCLTFLNLQIMTEIHNKPLLLSLSKIYCYFKIHSLQQKTIY